MTIEANVRTPEQLFQSPIRYIVPAYQRRYIWNRERQWEPLWEDVKRLADTYLELSERGTKSVSQNETPRHFLGAVVLQQEVTATGAIGMRRVIDGQQRLTTLQILLDAVQEVYEVRGVNREANLLEALVLNGKLYVGDDPDERFKVWPTLNDQSDYRFAMRNDSSGARPEDSLIVDAHDYFRGEVEEWLQENADVPIASEALRLVLSQMLQVVVIDLDADAEPQIIFETLNARGTPLLQADLVRNYMIFKAKAEGLDEDEFNRRWLVPYNEDWWQVEAQFGALRRTRLEQFLFYWVTMQTRDLIRVDDVFRYFQQIVDSPGTPIEETAREISRAAEVYRQMQSSSRSGPMARWHSYLDCRRQLSINVDSPLLLWLHTHDVPEEDIDVACSALESWFVRRQVWGRISAGVNRLMVDLVAALDSKQAGRSTGSVVVDHLVGQAGSRMSWTSDTELIATLTEHKSFGRISRARIVFLLERLEARMRRDSEQPALPLSLQIEHVMPQRWEQHWPLDGVSALDQLGERQERDKVVHFLGNLTLVTPEYNQKVTNRGWGLKKEELDKNTVLFLNKDVVAQGGDSWAVDDIQERSERLAQLAVEIWPGPDKF